MPTGYTADVQSGKVTDFRTFALRCARAFGACIMQRDDNSNALPKDREESTFYLEALDRARTRVKYLENMSDADADVEARQALRTEIAQRAQRRAELDLEQQRYAAMLVKVEAWLPPTLHHVELKNFLIQQLRESMRFDDARSFYTHSKPTLLSGAEWRAKELASARKDVTYYMEEVQKERDRVASANEWIDTLYKSLS